MKELESIQQWYQSQCDGDWEHSYGIKIDTLDNPGWSVSVDLEGTELEKIEFTKTEYGLGSDAESSGDDWLLCKKEGAQFIGCGGPTKLKEILHIFTDWTTKSKGSIQTQ